MAIQLMHTVLTEKLLVIKTCGSWNKGCVTILTCVVTIEMSLSKLSIATHVSTPEKPHQPLSLSFPKRDAGKKQI